MKRVSLLVSMMLIASMVLAACGGGGGGGPSAAARDWFAAFSEFNFDRVKELTCSSQQAALDSALGAISGAGADFDLSQMAELIDIDFSGLNFAESNVTGDSATVDISGKLKVSFLGQSQEEDLTQSVPMVNENGWKVCTTEFGGLPTE